MPSEGFLCVVNRGTMDLSVIHMCTLHLCLHRWAAGVAYMHESRILIALHYAMPFGASGSVVAWHRIGDLICKIARRLLHIALLRYVDDYFGPEILETMQHCLEVVARLCRCILGGDAVAVDKLECGATLGILGIQVIHTYFSLLCVSSFLILYVCRSRLTPTALTLPW